MVSFIRRFDLGERVGEYAERVLLEVRTGTERARADHAIALARLEGAIGGPLGPENEGVKR